jgi:hypothetical protein
VEGVEDEEGGGELLGGHCTEGGVIKELVDDRIERIYRYGGW